MQVWEFASMPVFMYVCVYAIMKYTCMWNFLEQNVDGP